jgi:hypothetical protein
MSGAIPVLPLYAFMTWTGATFPLYLSACVTCMDPVENTDFMEQIEVGFEEKETRSVLCCIINYTAREGHL